jgi:flavin reductase (DIM6/NTAB) family NADH-FMN oxidoreductase RutF
MEQPNLITVAWTGTLCTNPTIVYVSIRPERYSHELIRATGKFAINLTTKKMVKATDFCGVKSGRDLDKFKETGLTPVKGNLIDVPIVEESPLSLECEVIEIKPLGSHDLFMAKVIGVSVEESLMDASGKFRLDQAGLIAYSHGAYYELGQSLGTFGYSVMKKKTKMKRKGKSGGKRV